MVNIAVLVAGKLAAGVLGHSHALVADVESLADTFSSIVVWRGLVVAEELADEDHPYGHGKAEAIAGAIVSTMLLLAAAGIAVQSVRSIAAGDHPGPRAFTLLVLLAVVATSESLFRFVKGEAVSVDSMAVHVTRGIAATPSRRWRRRWHHRITGGRGYEAADDVGGHHRSLHHRSTAGAVAAGADELMDTSPNHELIEEIRKVAETISGVERWRNASSARPATVISRTCTWKWR